MPNFRTLRYQLVRALGLPEYVRAYKAACKRQVAFAHFVSLEEALNDVVGLEGRYGRADGATQDAFYRALLDEYTLHPHPVWSTAIVAGFVPAATRIKRRTQSSAHDDEAIGDLVLIACLEAIQIVARDRHRDRLPMRIRQAMRRHVFGEIRRVSAEQKILQNLKAVALSTGAIEPFAAARSHLTPHAGELLAEIREFAVLAEDGDKGELASALGAAATQRQLLRLTLPELADEDQEQLYQRLKKRRSRALARVKRAADEAALDAEDAIRDGARHSRRKRKDRHD